MTLCSLTAHAHQTLIVNSGRGTDFLERQYLLFCPLTFLFDVNHVSSERNISCHIVFSTLSLSFEIFPCCIRWHALIYKLPAAPLCGAYFAKLLQIKRSSFNPTLFTSALHLSEPGSVVGIAIGYVLDGPRIESRWGRDFLYLSRLALGPTQPPLQWVLGLSWG